MVPQQMQTHFSMALVFELGQLGFVYISCMTCKQMILWEINEAKKGPNQS
jgi:hypothetical protein